MDWLITPPPLVEIESGQFIHEAIVDDVQNLQQQAALQGVNVNIASGYRSIERQLAIWNAKWSGTRALISRDGQALNPQQLTDREKLQAILTWSALPGASRHHWGTDFDVYDKFAMDKAGTKLQLVVPEFENGGPCAPLSDWLSHHAYNLKFARPYIEDKGGIAKEPWHLSHFESAKQFEAQLDLESLTDFITGIDIAGKSAILQNIGWIFPRYVLNKGDRT
ncbi:MAG: M15 family metallopeptidase [Aestuariibacter sp.]